MSDAPLCPALYQILAQRFGRVTISNHREPFVGVMALDVKGRPQMRVRSAGEYYCVSCFAPETPVATPAGDVPIRDLVGKSRLLIPNRKGLGSWKDVEVRSFGKQALLTVTLRKKRAIKKIRVTPDHRWLVSGRLGLYLQKTTAELCPGDVLPSCFARGVSVFKERAPAVSAPGVAQGFVFGDGSCERKKPGPAYVVIHTEAKDAALLPFFSNCRMRQERRGGKTFTRVCDLPRSWKKLPDAGESLSFLLGWFAGYFAADGHVSSDGKQATIFSARREHLNFVKGVCYQLGVRVSPIRPRKRASGGCVPHGGDLPLFGMSFAVRDLPDDFWIIGHHKQRVLAKKATATHAVKKTNWTVSKVEDRGEVTEVFCAVVPGIEKFTLADNILTMNCPFCRDRRRRLWINHTYGQLEADGRPRTWAAVCYNEGCLQDHDNRQALYDMTLGFQNARARGRPLVIEAVPADDTLFRAEPAGEVVPISSLPQDHPAVQYLRSRRYTDEVLAAFEIGYVVSASRFPGAQGRIYFPIKMHGELVGWQVRQVHATDSGPKYSSMPRMKRRLLLYNYDRAKTAPWVVVTEGPTDVHVLPDCGVGCLGKGISGPQMSLILLTWARKPVFVLFDGDAREETYHTAMEIASQRGPAGGPVIPVYLPPEHDPGDYSTESLWRILQEAAAPYRVVLPDLAPARIPTSRVRPLIL